MTWNAMMFDICLQPTLYFTVLEGAGWGYGLLTEHVHCLSSSNQWENWMFPSQHWLGSTLSHYCMSNWLGYWIATRGVCAQLNQKCCDGLHICICTVWLPTSFPLGICSAQSDWLSCCFYFGQHCTHVANCGACETCFEQNCSSNVAVGQQASKGWLGGSWGVGLA